jgi:hypothetical protein
MRDVALVGKVMRDKVSRAAITPVHLHLYPCFIILGRTRVKPMAAEAGMVVGMNHQGMRQHQ